MTTMSTTAGAPIADNQNSLTAGPRGPLLMQDYQLLEKLIFSHVRGHHLAQLPRLQQKSDAEVRRARIIRDSR